MIQKHNAILENPFMRDPGVSHSLNLLNSIFNDISYNTDGELSHLKKYSYVYALLDYGDWASKPDVFRYITGKALDSIRKRKCFFIFDASTEGFSPTGDYEIFDYLHNSCRTHKIDPEMVIYLTGNLKDEENMIRWTEETHQKPLNVISYLAFETIILGDTEAKHSETYEKLSTNDLHTQAVTRCKQSFKDKYFSSLSRVNRYGRTNATFMLCNHEISKNALISHNTLNKDETENLKRWAKNTGYSETSVINWATQLPLIVDHSNFEVNWAVNYNQETPWGHIFDQTLFQITNETLVDNENNTSLFYSEKTFKPILKFQPFVIYGQPGCNHELARYGYKLYSDWFDLSFDFEEDNTLRYKKLLESVNKACKHLDTLSRNEKINWRFKNEEVLRHNCNVLKRSAYSKNKLYQFFKNLR